MNENIDQKLQHMAIELAERLARGLESVISGALDSAGISQIIEKLSGEKQKYMKENDTEHRKNVPDNGIENGTQKNCSEPDCNLPARARGLCSKHYQRLRYAEKRASELGHPPPKTLSEAKANRLNKSIRKTSKRGGGTCSKEGCDRPNYAKGLCGKHFMEWVRSKKNEEDEN